MTITQIIRTGAIPESECPRCKAPLMVVNKRHAYFGQAPQFVGCTEYPACGYVTTVTEDVAAKMDEVQRQADLQPAEF